MILGQMRERGLENAEIIAKSDHEPVIKAIIHAVAKNRTAKTTPEN